MQENQNRDKFSLFADESGHGISGARASSRPPISANGEGALLGSPAVSSNERSSNLRPSSSGSRSRNRILHGRPSSAQSSRSSKRIQSPASKKYVFRGPEAALSLGEDDVYLRRRRGTGSRGESHSPARVDESSTHHYLQR